MGRTATGVIGIKLDDDDQVVSLEVIQDKNAHILTVTDRGYGKRTTISEYRVTKRGGKGIITIRSTEKNGKVIRTLQVTNDTQIMLVTTPSGKIIRIKASGISVYGRGAQGLRLIDLDRDERVAAVAKVVEREDDDDDDEQIIVEKE